MQSSQYEITLLVDNKPIREYTHEGRVFVEGRSGSDYKIRIRNNSTARACFVVSVDGLSIVDGKLCSDSSTGYVIEAWQQLDIACYKVDSETGAKFVFGTKEKSYSAEIGHGTDNVGVIGAVVFREVAVIPPQQHSHHYYPVYPPVVPYPYPYPYPRTPWLRYQATNTVYASAAGGAGPLSSDSIATGSLLKKSSSGERSAVRSFTTSASVGSNSIECDSFSVASAEQDAQLGTSFGEAMEWKTQQVSFKREAVAAARLEIFYDTRKNLDRRGVKLESKAPPLPNAFPGNEGCPVPANWKK